MARRPKPSGRPLSKHRRRQRRPLRRRFLIVCEGEQTEPNYFRRFRANAVIRVVGTGRAPQGVLETARQEKEKEDFDEVWLVFDKDEIDAEAFNRVIQQAKNLGFHVAYSNPAFELWYLLHFVYQNTALTRRDCQQRLKQHLGRPYRKNDPTLYDALLPYQETALRHAQRLESTYAPPRNPAQENPSTMVHHLVQALLNAT